MDKKILTALINILWIDKDWEPYTGEMYVGIVSGKYAYVTNPRSLSPYQLLKIPVDFLAEETEYECYVDVDFCATLQLGNTQKPGDLYEVSVNPPISGFIANEVRKVEAMFK